MIGITLHFKKMGTDTTSSGFVCELIINMVKDNTNWYQYSNKFLTIINGEYLKISEVWGEFHKLKKKKSRIPSGRFEFWKKNSHWKKIAVNINSLKWLELLTCNWD